MINVQDHAAHGWMAREIIMIAMPLGCGDDAGIKKSITWHMVSLTEKCARYSTTLNMDNSQTLHTYQKRQKTKGQKRTRKRIIFTDDIINRIDRADRQLSITRK